MGGAARLAAVVPVVLVGPIAGVYVDRWDFRRTMLVNDLIRAALIGALVVLPLLPGGTLPVAAQLSIVYAVVLLASAAAQFFNPARFAIIGDIMSPDDRPKASSIGQATGAVAAIVGPPIAAPLLFTAGVHWALAINAVSFLVSFVAVRSVRVPAELTQAGAQDGHNVWREFTGGISFFARSRVLMAVLVSAMLVMFGAGSVNALDVFFVTTNLGAEPELYGLLGLAFGVGSIAGALVAGAVAGKLGLSRTYWLAMLLGGVLFGAYARTTSLPVGVAVLALAAVPLTALNTVVAPIILKVTPREYLGRVISALQTAIQLCTMLSIAIAAWLASTVLRGLNATVAGVHFGTYDTIFVAAGVMIVVGALYAMAAMRGVDAAPAGDAAPAPEPARATPGI